SPSQQNELRHLRRGVRTLVRTTRELQATVARNVGRLEAQLLHLSLVEDRREASLAEHRERLSAQPVDREHLHQLEQEVQTLRHENGRLVQENAALAASLARFGALRYRAADKVVGAVQRIPLLYPLLRSCLRSLLRICDVLRNRS